ncbi:DUF983 domain-containing protein [Azospirillum sp. HJ39]
MSAGLRCVCPRCGRGTLYTGYLTVAERCGSCGLDFSQVDSGDGPAVFLIFILGFLVVPVALWVSMNVDWPLWLHAIVWSIVVLGLTLGMLRPAKAYVVALQYRYRRSEVEKG